MDLPAEPRLRWLLRASARLLGAGAEPVSGLVLPNAEFFPDAFDGTGAAVGKLLSRLAGYAGLPETELRLGLASPEGEEGGGGCGTGACCGSGGGHRHGDDKPRARVERGSDGAYVVNVQAAEARHPTVLTTALVQGVAAVFCTEVGVLSAFAPAEVAGAVEVAGALLGFGVLLANGAHILQRGCGGVKVVRATRLPLDELAVATAIQCELFGTPERVARAELDPTPRTNFDGAVAWVRANRGVVRLVRTDTAAIEADSYALCEGRSWLGRVFGIGRARGASVPTDDDLAALERELALGSGRGVAKPKAAPADAARQQRLAELRALVDESLDG
ncbi:MAG: hypothetical protein IT373_04000 [Polyangiaceae bacterium]|nr:hypothetical protein [Polyangiaceae bacterium]